MNFLLVKAAEGSVSALAVILLVEEGGWGNI